MNDVFEFQTRRQADLTQRMRQARSIGNSPSWREAESDSKSARASVVIEPAPIEQGVPLAAEVPPAEPPPADETLPRLAMVVGLGALLIFVALLVKSLHHRKVYGS
jgi:hypothetical protein